MINSAILPRLLNFQIFHDLDIRRWQMPYDVSFEKEQEMLNYDSGP